MRNIMMKRALIPLLVLVFSIPAISQQNMGMMKHSFLPEQMMEDLKLTPEQEAQMKDLRYNHQKEMIKLESELKGELLDLKQLKQADEPTKKKIFSQIDKVGAARIAIEKAKADHQLEVRNILTEEQYKAFRNKMHKNSEFGGRHQGESGKGDSRQGRPHRK